MDATLVDVFEEAENVDGKLRVEIAGGFVGQHQRGFSNDRASNGHSLLLATGQGTRKVGATTPKPNALEGITDRWFLSREGTPRTSNGSETFSFTDQFGTNLKS